jgi:hypothetical protein
MTDEPPLADDDTHRACSSKFPPAFPLTDDDIANIKAEFMAGDPKVTFVIHDEDTDHG